MVAIVRTHLKSPQVKTAYVADSRSRNNNNNIKEVVRCAITHKNMNLNKFQLLLLLLLLIQLSEIKIFINNHNNEKVDNHNYNLYWQPPTISSRKEVKTVCTRSLWKTFLQRKTKRTHRPKPF